MATQPDALLNLSHLPVKTPSSQLLLKIPARAVSRIFPPIHPISLARVGQGPIWCISSMKIAVCDRSSSAFLVQNASYVALSLPFA
jgi:hypothetical protein